MVFSGSWKITRVNFLNYYLYEFFYSTLFNLWKMKTLFNEIKKSVQD